MTIIALLKIINFNSITQIYLMFQNYFDKPFVVQTAPKLLVDGKIQLPNIEVNSWSIYGLCLVSFRKKTGLWLPIFSFCIFNLKHI